MNKQDLIDNIHHIDYTCDSITHTIEYLQACLLELLRQREDLSHKLNILQNKSNPVGFKSNKDSNDKA